MTVKTLCCVYGFRKTKMTSRKRKHRSDEEVDTSELTTSQAESSEETLLLARHNPKEKQPEIIEIDSVKSVHFIPF